MNEGQKERRRKGGGDSTFQFLALDLDAGRRRRRGTAEVVQDGSVNEALRRSGLGAGWIGFVDSEGHALSDHPGGGFI